MTEDVAVPTWFLALLVLLALPFVVAGLAVIVGGVLCWWEGEQREREV